MVDTRLHQEGAKHQWETILIERRMVRGPDIEKYRVYLLHNS